MKYADQKLSMAIAATQDYLFNSLKRKSVREVCEVITYEFDDELGPCDIYYREIYAPKSNQTDECCDQYTVEAVKLNDEQIEISSSQEQDILNHLNERFA